MANMNTIWSGSRTTTSRNATATLAFQQYRKAQEEASDGVASGDRPQVVKMGIERLDQKFRAKLVTEVTKALSVFGPKRATRPEAVCDGVYIARAFANEGPEGARSAAKRLEGKRWSPQELEKADEGELDQLNQAANYLPKPELQQRLIPPGEGWTRYDEDKLVNQQSQVIFVQSGVDAGKYLKRSPQGSRLEEVGCPNVPREHPITLSAASASSVRRGAKTDRAVLLNDVTKIARLALKFPLSFVDTPACAFALFQGLRTPESAQWCAENFHKKLLPILAEKIHTYELQELQDVLRRTLEQLDAELMLSAHAFSGCGALLALVLGDKLVVAGVGRGRVALLPDRGPARPVLKLCAGDPSELAELERVQDAGGVVHKGLVHSALDGLDEAARVLSAGHVFDVLQLDGDAGPDLKQVRSAYRRLALRVHPDKLPEGADPVVYKKAFARLDSAKDALEAMLSEDAVSCRELHLVLRSEARTRAGAAALLGTEDPQDADKACKQRWKKLERMRHVAPDFALAEAICREAVATLGRGFSVEGLPRQEMLLQEGLPASRAMGARDLRAPREVVLMRPETAARVLPPGRHRVALLLGATAALSDEALASSTVPFARQPKASALRWCADADAEAACCSAICLAVDASGGAAGRAEEPAAKRPRAAAGSEGTVRVRHILFSHQQLRQPDPLARRPGAARTLADAELAALAALGKLVPAVKDPNAFLRLCREVSDCQSAAQPGPLAGDLGWLSRGQQEASFEDAAFALAPNTYSDIITTSRGVHILQRLA